MDKAILASVEAVVPLTTLPCSPLLPFCLLFFTLQPLLCPLEASQTAELRLPSWFPPIINLMFWFAKPMQPMSC